MIKITFLMKNVTLGLFLKKLKKIDFNEKRPKLKKKRGKNRFWGKWKKKIKKN